MAYADAWLAITENRIGPHAYRPQDVVRAANGVTIQVIHTDAEGRMRYVFPRLAELNDGQHKAILLQFPAHLESSGEKTTLTFALVYEGTGQT